MQVHCGSRDFEGDVGVLKGLLRAAVAEVELIRPLPPRLTLPETVPPRDPPPPAAPPPRTLLSCFSEYDELAFRENLNAGD